MPRARAKKAGVGAVASCKAKLLKPRQLIQAKYPNTHDTLVLEGLNVLRQEIEVVRRKDAKIVYMSHADMEGAELKTNVRNIRVTTEGPPESFFDIAAREQAVEEAEGQAENDEGAEVVNGIVENANRSGRITEEEVNELRGEGVEVDDDNEPAPENVPHPNQSNANEPIYSEWGWSGLEVRRQQNIQNHPPSYKGKSEATMGGMSYLDWFLVCFPTGFVKNHIIPNINQNLRTKLTFSEFIVFLGCILYMARYHGHAKKEWWKMSAPSMKKGAPFRLSDYMSGKRFDAIHQALLDSLTTVDPPEYADKFWRVREFIDEWNANMADVFVPSWVSCLDESMMAWMNKYTCPGWMVVPRKPHPFGNEFHTIACGMCGILYAIEIVEGKDKPRETGRPEFDNLGKTVGLMLRLTKMLWNTGKVVVLDSGFCVLKGIVELLKRGVYASAVIKKRRYWPAGIKGDEIKEHMSNKQVGEVDALPGVYDEKNFHVFCMKEPAYTMMLMSTYGGLQEVPSSNAKRVWQDDNGVTQRK